jgi:hypothetical protein
MKRGLSALLIYLGNAAGVGAGHYTNDPYKGNSIAVFKAATAGLVWPVVVTNLLAEKVGEYYGKVGG